MRAETVLVVEDDPMLAMVLVEVLEDMGHLVCAIESSQNGAVAAAARLHPSLIIADQKLNPGDGVQALMEILRVGPVHHLFMSGNAASIRAALPDATVVEKPFTAESLAAAIDRALGGAPPFGMA